MQNSYIFLSKEPAIKEKPKDQSGNIEIVVDVGSSLVSLLVAAFPGLKRINAEESEYDHHFSKIFQISVNIATQAGASLIPVEMRAHEVKDMYYLDVEAKGEFTEVNVGALEWVQAQLQSEDIEKHYIIIVSYDSVSQYYCNLLYPKLNELERVLRKLLFNVYVVNLGKDYYQLTISEDIQNKAKANIQAKKNKEETRLKQFFYSMEFSDVQNALFTRQWTKKDDEDRKRFLASHANLSKLSDEELRAAMMTAPKSDWDRFFADKMEEENISELIEKVRKYRNQIAHCKIISRVECETCSTAIEELIEALKKAITVTEEEDFARKNTEALREAARSFIEKNEALLQSVHQAAQKAMESLPQIGLALVNSFSIDREAILKSASASIQNIGWILGHAVEDEEGNTHDQNGDNV